MLQLIEDYDHGDLERCWKWVYLSRLVGTDLTQDAHYVINKDGSDYDDDVGGSFVFGGGGGNGSGHPGPHPRAYARANAFGVVRCGLLLAQ